MVIRWLASAVTEYVAVMPDDRELGLMKTCVKLGIEVFDLLRIVDDHARFAYSWLSVNHPDHSAWFCRSQELLLVLPMVLAATQLVPPRYVSPTWSASNFYYFSLRISHTNLMIPSHTFRTCLSKWHDVQERNGRVLSAAAAHQMLKQCEPCQAHCHVVWVCLVLWDGYSNGY